MIKKALGVQRSAFSVRGGFVSASGFLCTFFGSSSGAPEGFPKVSRRIPEENNKKKGNRYEEYLFHRASVHTLQFPFSTTPFLTCKQGFRHRR